MKSSVVVGLGKIGLPLAVQVAEAKRRVIGVDINPQVVELVNQGLEPFPGEEDLSRRLMDAVESGSLQATVDATEAARGASEIMIVVPLYVDELGIPDFSGIDSATKAVGRGLRSGTLVSYETTVPVGTTRNRFAKILEAESGLVAGSDFSLVFSPERVLTGRVFADLRRYPKLLGGTTVNCGQRGTDFYSSILTFDERTDLPKPNGVWNLGTCEAAELAKLAETTYRDVNIALANEFSRFASRNAIDFRVVVEACNSQYFSHIHRPGIAVGGHCLPVYSQMYLWNDPTATVVRAARETNRSMPEHCIRLLETAHGPLAGQNVLILGASYRGDVKETSFSGVFDVVNALTVRKARCWVSDPYFTSEELEQLGLPIRGNAKEVEAIVIQADHAEYRTYKFSDHPVLRTVLNGRGIELRGMETPITIVHL